MRDPLRNIVGPRILTVSNIINNIITQENDEPHDNCQLRDKLVIWWSRRHRGACLDFPRIDELASAVVGCGMVSLWVASLRKYKKSNASLCCGTRVPVFVPAACVNAGSI